MFKRSKGFTLIELLIVVAIIGILAALLIPNMMTAMQRAKQKGTMADISTFSTYLMDYTTDRGVAPAWDGTPYTNASSLYTDLVPAYARALPSDDQWGNGFLIYGGSDFNSSPPWGFTSSGNDDFAIGSLGRDGADGWTDASGAFNFGTAGAVTYVNDFDGDLISWNGQFVCRPSTTSSGT